MNSAREIELELVRRCQQGSADAFDSLYDRFGEAVWRLCYRMAGNTADAEDLAQDVWVTVWQRIGSFRCESAFYTWGCIVWHPTSVSSGSGKPAIGQVVRLRRLPLRHPPHRRPRY